MDELGPIKKMKRKAKLIAAFKKKGESLRLYRKAMRKIFKKDKNFSFDQVVLKEIEKKKFPEWTGKLIAWDANRMDNRSMEEFAEEMGTSYKVLCEIRRRYPGYWTAVKYRSREFDNEFEVFVSKMLVKRIIEKSDKALEIGLTMTGAYMPTSKHQIEELTPEDKRQRVENMLEELRNQKSLALPSTEDPESKPAVMEPTRPVAFGVSIPITSSSTLNEPNHD